MSRKVSVMTFYLNPLSKKKSIQISPAVYNNKIKETKNLSSNTNYIKAHI